jgi:hypothetical protein
MIGEIAEIVWLAVVAFTGFVSEVLSSILSALYTKMTKK